MWARSGGGSGTENSFSISVQRNGNTYVTGQFDGNTVAFGNTILTSNGSSDVFIAKYDASGNLIWAKNVGGKGYDSGLSIVTDSAGNCYVTGSFEDTVSFDNVVLTSTGASDMFVAKYNASGSLLWAKSAGSYALDGGTCITADRAGNSYVAGFYNGNFTFGTTSLVNLGYEDFFIAKYDPAGSLLWVQGVGGAGLDWPTGITTDKNDLVYLTGWYNSASLTFGGKTINNTGQNDLFVVRFDPSGNVQWAKHATGAGSELSLGIAVDSSSNSYITGYFTGNNLGFGTTILNSAGGEDIFIAKYDPAGNALWAKRAGGQDRDMGYAIATDAGGYSYMTGLFVSSNASFGNTVLQNTTSWPMSDLFVAKYDPSGNISLAKSAGDAGMDVGNSIGLDALGNCYLTGTFSSNIRFGSTTLNAVAGSDMFIAKLYPGSTGIKETSATAGFSVYPNPASDQVRISFQGNGMAKQTVRVFDCTGRLMVTKEVSSKELVIDMQHWPAGLYQVRVGREWQSILKK